MAKIEIIKKVDDLGRITIPKEFRKALHIKEGTPMEVSIQGKSIVLKKYDTETKIESVINDLIDVIVSGETEIDTEKFLLIQNHAQEIINALEECTK